MATTIVVLCMLIAASLLSLSESQQQECACGKPDDNIDYRGCDDEDILVEKFEENKNSYLCQRYVLDDDAFAGCKFESPDSASVFSLNQFADLHSNYTIYRVFSRNFHSTECCYPPRLFCMYNVECERDEILSYWIISSDLRAKHEIRTEPGKCSDRLTIRRFDDDDNDIITCGRDTSLEQEDKPDPAERAGTENRRLTVKFHSSPDCHNCGFFMFADCVKRSFYNQQDCMDTSNIQKRDTRKNSDAEKFLNRFGKRSFPFKSFRCEVPVGATITYTNKILTVTKMNKVWKRFKNIWLFRVYNKALREFTDIYGSSGVTYNGYGILTVGKGVVQYIQTGVDPRLTPTPAENEIIILLLRELLARVPRFRNDRLNFSNIRSMSTPDRYRREMCPTDPSKGNRTCIFDEGPDVVGKRSAINMMDLAERAAISCNGIVRSIGDYVLRENPRLRRNA